MVAALLGLALATAGLLVGVWLGFYALLSFFGVGAAASVAAGRYQPGSAVNQTPKKNAMPRVTTPASSSWSGPPTRR